MSDVPLLMPTREEEQAKFKQWERDKDKEDRAEHKRLTRLIKKWDTSEVPFIGDDKKLIDFRIEGSNIEATINLDQLQRLVAEAVASELEERYG